MTTGPDASRDSGRSGARTGPRARRLARAALVAALVVPAVLAWRPIRSADLGYHLAYGDTFLQSGRIVDGDDFLYVDGRLAELHSVPGNRPPGAWIDSAGRYRFPNANYGSQILMSMAHQAAGFVGLCLLQAALVAVAVLLAALWMRRLGLGTELTASGILLIAAVAYPRFDLRPELFGYVLLMAVAVLASAPRLSRRSVLALALCQITAVQLHSYWILGLVVVAGLWAEAVADTVSGHGSPEATAPRGAAPRGRLLAAGLGAMTAVSFVNPWGWRLAALPVQTLAFLRANGIPPAAGSAPDLHPWALISEFARPLRTAPGDPAEIAAWVVLGLGAAGAASATWRRRWARAATLLVMMAVALSMERNLAPAALVLVPLALASLSRPTAGGSAHRTARGSAAATGKLRTAVASALFVVATIWVIAVGTGHFYYWQRSPDRFGAGAASWFTPIDAARSLRRLPRSTRVFTPFDVSSTVLYFGRDADGFREVPILTNTWAYPAKTTMALNANLVGGFPYRDGGPDYSSFLAFAGHHHVGIVVLDCEPRPAGLARFLLRQGWQWTFFDGKHVVLVHPALARSSDRWDRRSTARLVRRIRETEPFPAYRLDRAGISLHRLGLVDQAESSWRAAVEEDPGYEQAWLLLGRSLLVRGKRERSRALMAEARRSLDRAVEAGADPRAVARLLRHLEATDPTDDPEASAR